jgi:hypothetical protein
VNDAIIVASCNNGGVLYEEETLIVASCSNGGVLYEEDALIVVFKSSTLRAIGLFNNCKSA